MKLVVQGIEEIELTDPSGLCNPPTPQVMPQLPRGQPVPSGWPGNQPMGAPTPFQPTPQVPTPFGDPYLPRIPGAGDVVMPHRPSIYTRHVDDKDKTKWGVGGEAIQRAGQQVDPEKFEKNWQSKMTGEDPENGNRSTD